MARLGVFTSATPTRWPRTVGTAPSRRPRSALVVELGVRVKARPTSCAMSLVDPGGTSSHVCDARPLRGQTPDQSRRRTDAPCAPRWRRVGDAGGRTARSTTAAAGPAAQPRRRPCVCTAERRIMRQSVPSGLPRPSPAGAGKERRRGSVGWQIQQFVQGGGFRAS
jgi:hypothetical protein